MMRFAEEIFSNPGSPIQPVYAPKVSKDGNIELVQTGTENIDEIIQSFRESTDMAYITQRLENGDVSVLNQRVGQYGDFTEMPKTYAEMLQLHIDAHNLFRNLPSDVRQSFDNDPDKFFATTGSQEWFDNMKSLMKEDFFKAMYPDKPVDQPKEVNKE